MIVSPQLWQNRYIKEKGKIYGANKGTQQRLGSYVGKEGR